MTAPRAATIDLVARAEDEVTPVAASGARAAPEVVDLAADDAPAADADVELVAAIAPRAPHGAVELVARRPARAAVRAPHGVAVVVDCDAPGTACAPRASPVRRPARAVCAACSQRLGAGEPPLVVSRCRHSLCAVCGVRSVAEMDSSGLASETLATMLRDVPMCCVRRCRAPLSFAEAERALVPDAADAAFATALGAFHIWRNDELPLDIGVVTGPENILFPSYTADMAEAALSVDVTDEDELFMDDLAGAFAPLWIWDGEYVRRNGDQGDWMCAACGLYDESNPSATSTREAITPANESFASDMFDCFGEHVVPCREPPCFPHCASARAFGVIATIEGLRQVGMNQSGSGSAEQKQKSGSSAGTARKKRSRYRSAQSVYSSKRRRVAAASSKKFAKGTGFAGSSGTEWKGANTKLLEKTAKVDAASAFWLARIRCYLLRSKDAPVSSWPGYMRTLLREYKLVHALSQILINDSIMDVGERVPVYVAALRVVNALTDSPSLRVLVTEPSDGESGRSVASLVDSLSKQAALLASGVGAAKLPPKTSILVKQIRRAIRGINRHSLLLIAKNRNAALHAVVLDSRETNEVDKSALGDAEGGGKRTSVSEAEDVFGQDDHGPLVVSEAEKTAYMEAMRQHQFATVPGLAESSSFYSEALIQGVSAVGHGKMLRRISSEVASLFSSLPLAYSSTILLRVDEDRFDFLRACVFGPEDTPYDSGAFILDIFIPRTYPEVPPKVKLLTTGGGRVRFNPNLYATGGFVILFLAHVTQFRKAILLTLVFSYFLVVFSLLCDRHQIGKVCLSLLGTWNGPSWTPASTLLQVLVSIQSLILVSEPFFNEPGYERMMGTANGKSESEKYNARVRRDCVVHAIHGNIRNSPPELRDGILTHFRLKRQYLLRKFKVWFPNTEEGAVGEQEVRYGPQQQPGPSLAAGMTNVLSSTLHSGSTPGAGAHQSAWLGLLDSSLFASHGVSAESSGRGAGPQIGLNKATLNQIVDDLNSV